jgi:hypothetical protein
MMLSRHTVTIRKTGALPAVYTHAGEGRGTTGEEREKNGSRRSKAKEEAHASAASFAMHHDDDGARAGDCDTSVTPHAWL